MLKEFREFISKGNVVDMAVGIIIGVAFTGIVSSFVKDIVTPVIGMAGKANFENMFLVLKPGIVDSSLFKTVEDAQKAGAVTLNYGIFLNAVINFLIIAFVMFMFVKAVNKMRSEKKTEAPAAPPEPTKEEVLLTEIRDILKSKP